MLYGFIEYGWWEPRSIIDQTPSEMSSHMNNGSIIRDAEPRPPHRMAQLGPAQSSLGKKYINQCYSVSNILADVKI